MKKIPDLDDDYLDMNNKGKRKKIISPKVCILSSSA